MARTSQNYLALDIGTVRVGVATAGSDVRIAVPQQAIAMDETQFVNDIAHLLKEHQSNVVVIGYPRNQSGEATAQTEYIEKMTALLEDAGIATVFQDESLTSVVATERLGGKNTKVKKGMIDSEAAAIILQDYLEQHL